MCIVLHWLIGSLAGLATASVTYIYRMQMARGNAATYSECLCAIQKCCYFMLRPGSPCLGSMHYLNAETKRFRNCHFETKYEKIAHWAEEFSTDAFGEMLAIICKCRSSKKNQKSNSE